MGAVSTSPYTTQSISGYNSSPPSDDGAQTAANQVSWSKHKTKIGDPIKTLTESVNSALVTAFSKSVNTDAGERNQFSGSVAYDWATATLATDSIYPTYSAVMVGSESGATSDTLQYISATGVYQGALLTIKQRNATEEIVLVHATSTAATATNANLYLTGNANVTLNDVNRAVMFSYDSGFASGWVPVAEGNSAVAASQAEMEAASSNTVFATPGRVNFHPGAAKTWVRFNAAGTIAASHNITSVSDGGTGSWTVNIGTDFSSDNYCALAWGGQSATGGNSYVTGNAPVAGAFNIQSQDKGTFVDPSQDYIFGAAFGDQA